MTKVEKFSDICNDMVETYKKKNHDYGNSFDRTCDDWGLVAAVVRMEDKINRLSQFAKKDFSPKVAESAEDTLKDLANYAILTLLWMDSKKEDKHVSGRV